MNKADLGTLRAGAHGGERAARCLPHTHTHTHTLDRSDALVFAQMAPKGRSLTTGAGKETDVPPACRTYGIARQGGFKVVACQWCRYVYILIVVLHRHLEHDESPALHRALSSTVRCARHCARCHGRDAIRVMDAMQCEPHGRARQPLSPLPIPGTAFGRLL